MVLLINKLMLQVKQNKTKDEVMLTFNGIVVVIEDD
jgi:hypothetical protein